MIIYASVYIYGDEQHLVHNKFTTSGKVCIYSNGIIFGPVHSNPLLSCSIPIES